MFTRNSKEEETVTSYKKNDADESDGESSKKYKFFSNKAHLLNLQDELKAEIVDIIAEISALGSPAIRQTLNVYQEELRLFLKSELKHSEGTLLKEIETTHFSEFKNFLDDLEKEVLSLENYLKNIQNDIKYYVEQNRIFSEREQLLNSLSERRVKKLKIEKNKHVNNVNNLANLKKRFVHYKNLMEEVVDMVFEPNVETAQSLLSELWSALNDGDKYVAITPEYEEIVASLYLVSLVKYHPHDSTKIKLHSDL